MGEVGGYTLHLYCDHPGHDRTHLLYPEEVFAQTHAGCVRIARKRGWLINPRKQGSEGTGFCLCPTCRRKKS